MNLFESKLHFPKAKSRFRFMENDHGYIAEKALTDICNKIFGQDLVVKSPFVIKASGKEELSDIIVDLYDGVFVFQSKSISLDISDLNEIKMGRIFKKLEHAKSQFRTFFSAERNSIRVECENALSVRYDLRWENLKTKIGVITLSLTDELYHDPEFRFQIPGLISEINGMEIHVFILKDLENISNEYNTPEDFRVYLKERSAAIKSGKLQFGNELDFVAYIRTEYPEFKVAISDESKYASMLIAPGYWEDYIKNEEGIRKKGILSKGSTLFDFLFKHLRASIEYEISVNGITKDEAVLKYRIFVSLLSKVRRHDRWSFQKKATEKIGRAEKRPYSYFVAGYPSIDLSILFVSTNEIDREKRIAILENLGSGASKVLPTSRILCIASPGKSTAGKFGFELLFGNTSDLKNTPESEKFKKMFQPLVSTSNNEWDVE